MDDTTGGEGTTDQPSVVASQDQQSHGETIEITSSSTSVTVQSESFHSESSVLSTVPVQFEEESLKVESSSEVQQQSVEVSQASSEEIQQPVNEDPVVLREPEAEVIREPEAVIEEVSTKVEDVETHAEVTQVQITDDNVLAPTEEIEISVGSIPPTDEPISSRVDAEPEIVSQVVPDQLHMEANADTTQSTVTSSVVAQQEQTIEEVRVGRSAEIQEENLRSQLNEIIQEIDYEVTFDENQQMPHTWLPKGQYTFQKTEVTHDDVVPVIVPDVPEPHLPTPPPKIEEGEQKVVLRTKLEEGPDTKCNLQGTMRPTSLKVLKSTLINGDVIDLAEIPIGIPLLAKILPKLDDEEEHEKIPLERLFTPATDWDEIIPQKKKTFSSSAFYGSDHPTIDDQVELAHKISVSLIDENNKTSRGQSMYIKRKNKSSKWIHGEEHDEITSITSYSAKAQREEQESRSIIIKEKPQLKLTMKTNLSQEFSSVQQNYEEILSTSQTLQQISGIELGKEITSNLQSPTGKGAALFAKRKKRMDKFIIDETSIQQQQNQSSSTSYEATSTGSTTTVNFQSKQESSYSSEQQTITHGQQQALPHLSQPNTGPQSGLKLPDLANILTKPVPPEMTLPKLDAKGVKAQKPEESKKRQGFQPQSLPAPPARKLKTTCGGQQIPQSIPKYYNASVSAGDQSCLSNGLDETLKQDPLLNIRPGSPPVFMDFKEQESQSSTCATLQSNQSNEIAITNGTKITAVEVTATNSGLQPPEYIQVPVSEFRPESLKRANNAVLRSEATSLKPVRPCSLPIVSLTHCNIPKPFNLNTNISSSACNNELDSKISKNNACLDASLATINNNGLDLTKLSNGTMNQKLLLSDKHSISPLIEPSCSEMSDAFVSTTNTLQTKKLTRNVKNIPFTLECDPIEVPETFYSNCKQLKTTNINTSNSSHTNFNKVIEYNVSKEELASPLTAVQEHNQIETFPDMKNVKNQDLRLILKELDNIMTFDDEIAIVTENGIEKDINSNELKMDIPTIHFDHHRDSLINEDELDKYISEIERTFSATPTVLDSINIQDLQPSEFYKSVSRNSIADEELEYQLKMDEDNTKDQMNKRSLTLDNDELNDVLHKLKLVDDAKCSTVRTNALVNLQNIDGPNNSLLTEPLVKHTRPMTSYSKSEGSSGTQNTNMSPWSADGGAMYTAEVKLVQQAAVVSPQSVVNIQGPQNQSALTDLTTADEAEKRKSFNLAPKGWGTYNNFYTPVHLGAR